MVTDSSSNSAPSKRYQLANLSIDLVACQVTHGGVEVALPKLSFDFLVTLLRHAPNIVSIDQLMSEVWGNTVVNDETVTQRAKLIRDALAAVDPDTTYVETVRGRGYRLAPSPQPVSTPTAVQSDADDSLLAWLYRRRIPQAIGGYAVVAWIVLQLADVLIQQLTLPPVAFRVVLIALSVGFPLAIVTTLLVSAPSQTRVNHRLRRVVVIALAMAAGVAVSAWWWGEDNHPSLREPVTSNLPGIAVLPFKDFSPQGDKAYFSDGIHDELLSRLASTEAFRVPSRTTMEHFRDSQKKATVIARELDVVAVLEGSVRHSGDRLLVTVQLIDGQSDDHMWSHNYERALNVEELFAIQRDIAVAIANQLQATLGAQQTRAIAGAPTQSFEAYEAVLKGRYYSRRYNAADLQRAVSFYQRAVDLDGSFADAWSGLANTYALAGTSYGWLKPDEAMDLARKYGQRALELNPNLGTVISLLGDIKFWFDRDWKGGEEEYLRAIAADPNLVGNRLSYAYLLSSIGRHDEAIGQIFHCLDLEPRSARVHVNAAWRFLNARQYERAIEFATSALALDSALIDAHTARGYGRALSGDLPGALEDARANGFHELVAFTLASMGRTDEAREELKKLEQLSKSFVPFPVSLAIVHTALGDFDAAFAQLEAGLASHHRGILLLNAWEVYDPLRADARFVPLLERIFKPDEN